MLSGQTKTINLTGSLLIVILLTTPFYVFADFGAVSPFAGTSTGNLITAITNIVNALLAFVAVVATIVIIFSTVVALSGRDEEDIARRAKSVIIYTVLGLIIVALSAVIINYLIRAIP